MAWVARIRSNTPNHEQGTAAYVVDCYDDTDALKPVLATVAYIAQPGQTASEVRAAIRGRCADARRKYNAATSLAALLAKDEEFPV